MVVSYYIKLFCKGAQRYFQQDKTKARTTLIDEDKGTQGA